MRAWLRRPLLPAVAVALLSACAPTERTVSEGLYDLVIVNGRIVDGSGNPWYRADVGIRGNQIAAIGDLDGVTATRTIDAANMIVAPGFIDLHSHASWSFLVDSRAASAVTQGITLVVEGEGHSVAPMNEAYLAERQAGFERLGVTPDWRTLDDFFRRLEANPATINFATYVGTGTLRELVVGREDRAATPDELAQMERLAAEAMEDGAFGVYSALMYPPDRFNRTEELIALARVAAHYRGVYQTHQRSEADGLFQSLDEVLRISREAGIPAHITHLKVAYVHNWGKMQEVVRRIDAARADGLDITADLYPYEWASASVSALLPPWAGEGDASEVAERLGDAAVRARIKKEMEAPSPEWENEYYGAGGAEGFRITDVFGKEQLKHYEGRSLADIARQEAKDPRDVIFDIIRQGDAGFISHINNEADIQLAMKQPWAAIGSDGRVAAPDGPLSQGLLHPRGYGTYPRVLGRYVRESNVIGLEEAIRKFTSLPAQRLGIQDRGSLRPGFYADVVIFDPATVIDKASYERPHQYAEGIEYVLVNGRVVVEHGGITEARPGRVVRGPGYRGAEQ